MDKKNITSHYLKELGERIREERKLKRLTQKSCAKLCGVSAPTQSLYENGERAPNAEYLFRLYENHFNTHYILTGEVTDQSPVVNTENEKILKDVLFILHRPDLQPMHDLEIKDRAELTSYLFTLVKSIQQGKLDKSSVEGIIRLVSL